MAAAIPPSIATTVLANQASSTLSPGPGNKWPGRVVINFNKNAIKEDSMSSLDPAVVQQMVDDSILCLTGESSLGAAWKAVFPSSLTAQSKIAIKVYSASPQTPSNWEAIKAMTDGLQQMDFNGTKFPAANITLYEGNASNRHSQAGFTAANLPGIKIEYWGRDQFADGTGNEAAGEIKDRAYAPTLKNADFLINAFNSHGTNASWSSFTLGFKNHCGTYELFKPIDIHYSGNSNATELCQQSLRDMNCTGPIYKKTVLSACIGLVSNFEGVGPLKYPDDYSKYCRLMDPTSTCRNSNTIIMSTDPISCEMQTVKMMRMTKGGKYGVSDMPKYLQASGGVSGALSGTVYNIGVIDESKMEIRHVLNGTTSIAQLPQVSDGSALTDLAASQLRGHAVTFIEYRLPSGHIGKQASISIYSLKGALIRKETKNVLGAINHFSWDNKDRAGRKVTKGTYIVEVKSGKVSLSRQFKIV